MADAQALTGIAPYTTSGTSFSPQWQVTDHANVVWQDTTSNATYSSASDVLSVT